MLSMCATVGVMTKVFGCAVYHNVKKYHFTYKILVSSALKVEFLMSHCEMITTTMF